LLLIDEKKIMVDIGVNTDKLMLLYLIRNEHGRISSKSATFDGFQLLSNTHQSFNLL
jgi:hypothetical protein